MSRPIKIDQHEKNIRKMMINNQSMNQIAYQLKLFLQSSHTRRRCRISTTTTSRLILLLLLPPRTTTTIIIVVVRGTEKIFIDFHSHLLRMLFSQITTTTAKTSKHHKQTKRM